MLAKDMAIGKEKIVALAKRMESFDIFEDDLIEKFILGSGRGGQKIQKTHSCVYLKHLPSGIEVKCQRDRSRELNRYLARQELCNKMQEKLDEEKTRRQKEKDKIRKQKKRRSRRLQQKLVEDKRQLSKKKSLRKTPSPSSDEEL